MIAAVRPVHRRRQLRQKAETDGPPLRHPRKLRLAHRGPRRPGSSISAPRFVAGADTNLQRSHGSLCCCARRSPCGDPATYRRITPFSAPPLLRRLAFLFFASLAS